MRFSVLTLFPELIQASVQTSITGRAIDKGLLAVDPVQIRDFAVNAYGQVDDTLYGGGTGMLLRPEPVFAAWRAVQDRAGKGRTIHLTPKGRVLNQKLVEELATAEHLILLCGHYEGIDQRALDAVVDLEVSIGDYVLTGGEIAANVLIDAVARLVPGVLPNEAAHALESHSLGRLEQPHYTRPASWQDRSVPDVLLSGHQAKIDRYQYLASLQETLQKRPDLFDTLQLSAPEFKELIEFLQTNAC